MSQAQLLSHCVFYYIYKNAKKNKYLMLCSLVMFFFLFFWMQCCSLFAVCERSEHQAEVKTQKEYQRLKSQCLRAK